MQDRGRWKASCVIGMTAVHSCVRHLSRTEVQVAADYIVNGLVKAKTFEEKFCKYRFTAARSIFVVD